MFRAILLSSLVLSGFIVYMPATARAQAPGLGAPTYDIPTYELPPLSGSLAIPGTPYSPGLLQRSSPTGFLVRPPTVRPPYNNLPYLRDSLPEYAPRGMQAGNFAVYPSITAVPTYNSNVFGTPSNEKSDAVITIAPELIGIKRSERNLLDVEANAEFNQYVHYNHLTNTNAALGLADAYEVAPDKVVYGGASYEILHLDPSLEEAVPLEPTEYHVASMSFGFLQRPTRFGYGIDGLINHFEYKPLHPASGGSVSQADDNYISFELAPTAYYALTPNYTAFSRLVLNTYKYDHYRDRSGFRRDSYGGKFDVGVMVDITRTLAGEVFAGALYQKYVDPAFGDEVGPDFGAGLGWSVTDRTLLGVRATRSIQQTRVRAASTIGPNESFSATESQIVFSADHLLLSNVLLHGDTAYTQDDFQTGNRTDREGSARVAMVYYINRSINTGPQIEYVRRFSDLPDSRYKRLLVMYRITAQY